MSNTGLRQPDFLPGLNPLRWTHTVGGSLLLWIGLMIGAFLTRHPKLSHELNIFITAAVLPFMIYLLANKTIVVSGKAWVVFLALSVSAGIVYALSELPFFKKLKLAFKEDKMEIKKAWPALLAMCLSWILVFGIFHKGVGLIDFSLPYETI